MNDDLKPIESGIFVRSYFGSFLVVGAFVLLFYNLGAIRKALNK